MKENRTHNPLERYQRDISRCVRCGSCSAVCPSFQHDRRESRSPRGRIALIEAVLAGRLAVSDLYKDRLAACTGCLACETQCASKVPVTAIIQAAKEQAARLTGCSVIQRVIAGALKHEGVMQSLHWLAPIALHFERDAVAGRGGVHGNRKIRELEYGMQEKSRDHGRPQRKKVIFYPGCAIRYYQQDIERATVAVLEHLGYDVVVPTGLKCCGRPFLSLGDRETAQRLAEHNNSVLASLSAEAVVTSCASCGLTFKQEYLTLLAPSGARPVPVVDIHEFLADKLIGNRLQHFHRRVTWHDPCHLGRGQGLDQIARRVLRTVPGLTLIEMSRPDRCCGFGGIMRATHPGLSRSVGRSKARDIVQTAAPVVVTGCPGCRMQIADSLSREGAGVTVMHTVQVLAEALSNAESFDRLMMPFDMLTVLSNVEAVSGVEPFGLRNCRVQKSKKKEGDMRQ